MGYPLKVFCSWLSLDLETECPFELFVDSLPTELTNSKKILVVVEPDFFTKIKENVIRYSEHFELILSYDNDILKSCKNSKLFVIGTSWIKDFNIEKEKQYCVTTLVGGKLLTYNHFLRQSLVTLKNEIKLIPFHIFNSKNYPCQIPLNYKEIQHPSIKNELFYSQYHIAIENCEMDNGFTEKIIDCFQTKTIPIYLGCPNIGDFFDKRGIIQVKNIKEIIDVCNSLNQETYNSMIEYVNKNYEISKKYLDFKSRLTFEINSFLGKI